MKGNYYGWFMFLGNAQFTLSAEGRKMIDDGSFKEFTDYYSEIC